MRLKKILIITFTVPYPATDGGRISVFGTVNYLRKHFLITLFFRMHHPDDHLNVEKLRKLWPEVNIIALDQAKKKKQWKKYFKAGIKASGLSKLGRIFSTRSSRTTVLSNAELFPFLPQDIILVERLEELFNKEKFDLIQVEVTYLLNLIHLLPPEPVKVFLQIENRHALLYDYFSKNNDNSLYANYIVSQAAFTEFALMNAYDHIFALTEKDKAELSGHISPEKIHLAPFPILDEMIATGKYVYQKPDKLIFLGSQQHKPNEDAVRWFAENMYTDILKKHGLKLYVTGNWQQSFQNKYPEIAFTGFVYDVAPLMKRAIMISPIRMGGGGIRAKALQSMAARVPLVSTRLGCDGIHSIEDGKNVLLADTPKGFIAAIEMLIENPGLHTEIVNNAYELIIRYYSEQAAGDIRKKIYTSIIKT